MKRYRLFTRSNGNEYSIIKFYSRDTDVVYCVVNEYEEKGELTLVRMVIINCDKDKQEFIIKWKE